MDTKKTIKTEEPVIDINEVSRISAGTVINGDVFSAGDIRIDGKIEGKVCSQQRVVVGEKAQIKGALLCENTDFWGKIDGDIYVKDTLSLMSTAVVNGSINVRRFQVEMGAQINCNCRMITEAEYDKVASGMIANKLPKKPEGKDQKEEKKEA